MWAKTACKVDSITGCVKHLLRAPFILFACILLLHDSVTRPVEGFFADMGHPQLAWSSAVLIRCPQKRSSLPTETMVAAVRSERPYAAGIGCSHNWSLRTRRRAGRLVDNDSMAEREAEVI